MKNLIAIVNKEHHEFDYIEEVIGFVFGEDYLKLSEEERFKIRHDRAFPICMFNANLELVNTKTSSKYDLEKAFVVDDDISYILSLCKTNRMLLLEKKDANILATCVDKSNIDDNYIVINTFATQILKDRLAKEKQV